MLLLTPLLVFLLFAWAPSVNSETVEELKDALTALEVQVEDMTLTMGNLARQTMMQQFFVEEMTRGDGDSGIKMTRGINKGLQNYQGSTHIGGGFGSFASIHDHSNYERTMGMGEISVVLNGVEFRTRHNDYKLRMPSTTSTEYGASEDLPFPDVPPAVSDLDDVDEQIAEMRQWFKAFKDQDHSARDYRKYFKPALCYLEGSWTVDKDLEEPFESDRHQLDAQSWFELQQNVRYNAYTGTKSRLENFAFLPTTIMSVNESTGVPHYAQWNYRIMCSPVEEEIPTSYLAQMEDLSFRYRKKKSSAQTFYNRGARFKLIEDDKPANQRYGVLDRIMYTIPGKDNLPGELRQDSFGEEMYKYDEHVELNTGYYHRWFKFTKAGAMGHTTVARGFNDENCFVAQTTQERIAPMDLEVCRGKKKNQKCQAFQHRFSFAIPLEIIYLTPLLTWNPYNLYRQPKLDIATAGKRNGDKNKPLDGTDGKHHYLTPAAFFKGETDTSDPADTVKNVNYVMDQDGDVHATTASGIRILLQDIEGVGQVRLRYPIAPVYGEGSSVWKELNAVRDYLFDFEASGGGGGGGGDNNDDDEDSLPEVIDFETSPAKKPTEHFHTFSISRNDYLALMKKGGLAIKVTTSEAAGHTHDLDIHSTKRGLEYAKCDGYKVCWDKHPRRVIEIRDHTKK